jgi:hypothetical protein
MYARFFGVCMCINDVDAVREQSGHDQIVSANRRVLTNIVILKWLHEVDSTRRLYIHTP